MQDYPVKTPRSAITRHSDRSEDASSSDSDGYFKIVRTARRRACDHSPKRPSPQMRVLLPEVVQITDVMPELWDKQIIGRNCYFEKYGAIEKVVLSSKETVTTPKKITRFLFITYKNQLDAAIAIAALQNYRHSSFKCLANYGATRYCAAFIKQIPCTYQDCYFLHEMKEESVTVENMRGMNKEEKIGSAYSRIADNLTYFIEKEYKQFINQKTSRHKSKFVKCQCNQSTRDNIILLPTIKQTLAWMIKQRIISNQHYIRLKTQYKANLKQKKQIKTSPVKAVEFIQENKQRQLQEPILQKKVINESYLLSRYLNPQLREADILDPDLQKLQDYYRKRQSQLKIKQPRMHKTLSMYQKLMNPSMAIDSYIHHKIINQIANRPSTMKSAFQFASIPRQDPNIQKIKSVVYRQLIMNI